MRVKLKTKERFNPVFRPGTVFDVYIEPGIMVKLKTRLAGYFGDSLYESIDIPPNEVVFIVAIDKMDGYGGDCHGMDVLWNGDEYKFKYLNIVENDIFDFV